MDLERLRRTEYNQQYIAAMRPVFNRRALFTDTSAEYVIPEEPEPYSEVTIRFRTARNNVDRIFLVSGGQKHLMVRVEGDNDFNYYAYVMRLYCGVLWKVKTLTLNILKGATWGTVGIRTRSAPFVCQTVS